MSVQPRLCTFVYNSLKNTSDMSEKEMSFIFCYVMTGIPPDFLFLVSGNKLLHMAFLFIVYRPKEYLRVIHDLSLTI